MAALACPCWRSRLGEAARRGRTQQSARLPAPDPSRGALPFLSSLPASAPPPPPPPLAAALGRKPRHHQLGPKTPPFRPGVGGKDRPGPTAGGASSLPPEGPIAAPGRDAQHPDSLSPFFSSAGPANAGGEAVLTCRDEATNGGLGRPLWRRGPQKKSWGGGVWLVVGQGSRVSLPAQTGLAVTAARWCVCGYGYACMSRLDRGGGGPARQRSGMGSRPIGFWDAFFFWRRRGWKGEGERGVRSCKAGALRQHGEWDGRDDEVCWSWIMRAYTMTPPLSPFHTRARTRSPGSSSATRFRVWRAGLHQPAMSAMGLSIQPPPRSITGAHISFQTSCAVPCT